MNSEIEFVEYIEDILFFFDLKKEFLSTSFEFDDVSRLMKMSSFLGNSTAIIHKLLQSFEKVTDYELVFYTDNSLLSTNLSSAQEIDFLFDYKKHELNDIKYRSGFDIHIVESNDFIGLNNPYLEDIVLFFPLSSKIYTPLKLRHEKKLDNEVFSFFQRYELDLPLIFEKKQELSYGFYDMKSFIKNMLTYSFLPKNVRNITTISDIPSLIPLMNVKD